MKSSIIAIAAAAGPMAAAAGTQTAYGQCGGSGWTGATACVAGYTCSTQNAYYAQCTPGAAAATTAKASSNPTPTTTLVTKATTAAATSKVSSAAAPASSSSGKVKFAGVNICEYLKYNI